jgi:hypothetical protein
LGTAATTATATSPFGPPRGSPTLVSSQEEFLELFRADAWRQNVVLLVDELNELYDAQPYIRDECLRAFREIRNNNKMYAIRSVIAADHHITIDDAVVEDIWAKSNGCVTLLNRSMRAQIIS